MFADLVDELTGRGIGVLLGLFIGGGITWAFARWKRIKERQSIRRGDARDTVVIHLHIVESTDNGSKRKPTALRIRAMGQSELPRVVPNGHLAAVLLKRAFHVTTQHTLISMVDEEGSYLLETLTNFVCDRISNGPFEHDLYVMAPCCEPADFALHQPITILLIAKMDLVLFEEWTACREVHVEHGSDGARILTLRALARRFREEQEHIATLREAGKRTTHVETMYVLDLAIDKRTATVLVKPVPWGRFESVLKLMNLE